MALKPPGRPSAYTPKFHDTLAFKITLLGASDRELADAFNVSHECVYEWQRLYPSFADSIARGKLEADAKVGHALYQRALGYEAKAVKIFMPAGAAEPVYAPYIEHHPPDTNAASLWLRNRRGRRRMPDEPLIWSERVEAEVSGSLTLSMLVAGAQELIGGEGAKVIEHDNAAQDVGEDVGSQVESATDPLKTNEKKD